MSRLVWRVARGALPWGPQPNTRPTLNGLHPSAQPSGHKRCNPFRVEAPIGRPPGVALREQPRAEGYNPFRIGIGQRTFRSILRHQETRTSSIPPRLAQTPVFLLHRVALWGKPIARRGNWICAFLPAVNRSPARSKWTSARGAGFPLHRKSSARSLQTSLRRFPCRDRRAGNASQARPAWREQPPPS